MKRIASRLCILWTVLILPNAWSAERGTEEAAALEKIIRDWEQRRQSIRSIEYHLEGQGFIPTGRWTGHPNLPPSVKGPVPANDYSYEISMKIILDFENGFAKTDERKELFYFPRAIFVPSQWIKVYDGERFVAKSPRETNSGNGYTPSDKQPNLWEALRIGSFFTEQASPVFLLSGRFRDEAWDVRKLDATSSLKKSTFAGKGKLSGRECVILRLKSAVGEAIHQEYWFETGSGSPLLRWSQYIGGQIVDDIRFSYSSGGTDAWPQSWDIAWYSSTQKLKLQNRMRVKSLQLNKSYERKLFQIERAPGMVVAAGKEGFVRVNGDGTTSKLPLAEGIPSRLKKTGRRYYLWVALALFGLCICIMVGRYLLGKWQTKSNSA